MIKGMKVISDNEHSTTYLYRGCKIVLRKETELAPFLVFNRDETSVIGNFNNDYDACNWVDYVYM